MPRLTPDEAALSGFTDVLRISYWDLLPGNAGVLSDGEEFSFSYAIPAGSHVRAAASKLITPFDDVGLNGDSLILRAGDSGDADGFLGVELHQGGGSPTTYASNTGPYLDQENGRTYTSDGALNVTMDPTISLGSYNLNNLSQGLVLVFFLIARN